jgi:hypothetical protein
MMTRSGPQCDRYVVGCGRLAVLGRGLSASRPSIDSPHVGSRVMVACRTLRNIPATGSRGHQSQPEAGNETLRTQSHGRDVLEGHGGIGCENGELISRKPGSGVMYEAQSPINVGLSPLSGGASYFILRYRRTKWRTQPQG